MDKENVVYTYRRILFRLKKKEIPEYVTRLNVEDIMQNKINQSRKDKCCVIPPCEISKVVKFTEKEIRLVVARGLGGGEMRSCSSAGIRFPLRKRSKCWRSPYLTAPRVSNTVLYTQILLKGWVSR